MITGTWTVSYAALKTFFQKADGQGVTEAFKDFNLYRKVLSERLSAQNPDSDLRPYVAANDTTPVDGYYRGYGPYSQDVLLPSFLAAYRKKDPDKVKLNPFGYFPLPNWRITYTGLSKFKFLQKVFSNVTISHAYNGTYSINSYQTQLSYQGNNNELLKPTRIDTATGNYYSKFIIPSIVMSEQFSPLLGIDMTFKNNILTRVEYKKTRNLSLSMLDYQLSESRTDEFTVGLGYKLKGLVLPIKIKGKKKKLDNDINFRVDFSYRNNITTNQKLDQAVSQPTQGMKTIRIAPTIDYIISNRLNIQLFFDRNRSIPATSASFPITNTSAGVKLRFTLAP
jgi:cell surface protein SprA